IKKEYDFITYSKISGSISTEFYLRKSKSLTFSDNFYDLQKTLIKTNNLISQTEKVILIKDGINDEVKYYALNLFNEALNIYSKIFSDLYFSLYTYRTSLSSTRYLGLSTYTGYSILFKMSSSFQEEFHFIDLHDILVRYIEEEFRYLKDWHIHQLHRYCRNNGIVAPLRKVEMIKTIQDSEPIKKPTLIFIDQLIKRPEIFKDIILHFLDAEDTDLFEYRCVECLYILGRRDVSSIFDATKNLSFAERVEFLFSNMKQYWNKDYDFTRIYLDFPKKEVEIKKYIKERYPNLFDEIFPQYLKKEYIKVLPEAIPPKSPIKFKKAFKKYKETIDILGNQGEKYIYEMLQEENKNITNLIIIWNNKQEESSKPYDILLKVGEKEQYIEVKTSINDEPKFTISERELNFALLHEDRYTLYHIINFNSHRMAYRAYKNLQKLMKEGKIETLNRTLKGNL
ncbi:MAG: DUF3883 domain-containing protein, partial [Candidatus Thorarchaeota archaeon]